MSGVAVGVDIGGTKIAGALVAADGAVLHHVSLPAPRSELGVDPSGNATDALVTGLLAHAEAIDTEVIGLGVGVPEYVDTHGRVTSSLVLASGGSSARWRLPEAVGPAATLDVVIESDVRCAAIAETRLGHGRNVASCLYVAIGTGVSHCFVIEGRVWSGQRGEAIAFGELPVAPDDCVVPDAEPTVEAQASGLALEGVAARFGLTPEAVADERLDAAHRRAGRVIARGLAMSIALFDPALVILGGGLGTSSGPFSESVDANYRSLTGVRPGAPPLMRASLGSRAGVIGAGLVAHDR